MKDINLTLSGSPLLLILSLLAVVGFTLFIYRRTNPPIPERLRCLLIALRTSALMVLVLILFQPLLSLTLRRQEKPVIGVLIDDSASMSLRDREMERASVVKRLLASPVFDKLSRKYHLKFYTFSDGITELDSLRFRGEGTDIARALKELKQRMSEHHLCGVILISDGAFNLGENPLRLASGYGIPIYTVGVGDPSQQKDVLISKIHTNEITYAENKVPVDVTIRSNGFEGKRVIVSLKHKGKVLDSKFLQLTGRSFEKSVRLHYLAEEEGLQKYRVEVSPLKGEITLRNNRRSFYVKVLKSKMKVLLVAGAPSPDYAFIKRALRRDNNIELHSLVQSRGGGFYQDNWSRIRTRLSQFDCLFLIGFPQRDSDPMVIEDIVRSNKPLFYLSGKRVDFYKMRKLSKPLPFRMDRPIRGERLVYLELSPQGREHPVMRLRDDPTENSEEWGKLPPIFSSPGSFSTKEGSVILGRIDVKKSTLSVPYPLIVARKSGERKALAVLGYGLWRWDLMMWGAGGTNEAFLKFLSNSIRWLVTREDTKLVRIKPDKQVYRSGEEVGFNAQVYYEDYRPLSGAEVKVTISRGEKKYELALQDVGDGKYEGKIRLLEGGDYLYFGEAVYKGRKWGDDEGKFSVGEYSLEFLNTRMNETLLKKISQKSGGKYYRPENIAGLAENLKFSNREVVEHREFEIWNRFYLLIAFILFLAGEWTIRRRRGML